MKTNKRTVIVVMGVISISTIVAALGSYGDEQKNGVFRDQIVTGRVVDLNSFMTGKFLSSDKVRSTRESIEAGVPVALETEDGLFVIGFGSKSPRKELMRWAYKNVEIKGTLYERSGLRYLDLEKVKLANPDDETDEGTEENAVNNNQEEVEEPDLGEEGACCLPTGTCIMTYSGNCTEESGDFNGGYTCEEIRCND